MLFQVLYHPSAHLNFMTTQQNNRARIAGVAIEYTGARLPEFKALPASSQLVILGKGLTSLCLQFLLCKMGTI